MKKPLAVTLSVVSVGVGLFASGVFLMTGAGPALVTVSLPFLYAGFVLVRGLTRG